MKALFYTGPKSMELRDVAAPQRLGDDEELVRVVAVGICGSDMHAFLGHDERRPAPLILGHEAAGVIASGPREGLRVTVNPLVTCGVCVYCRSGRDNICPRRELISMPPREGAFAECVFLPPRNLFAIPESLTFEKAAMTEPLACGWHAVSRAAQALSHDLDAACCLVIGGGAIGLGAALTLQAQGATIISIVEPNAKRRAALQTAGAFELIETADAIGADGRQFEIVIDAYGGSASRAAASRLVAPGGVIAHIGLAGAEGGLNARRMTLQEITFIGTYAYTMRDFEETLAALVAGRLGTLDWFDVLPLEDGATAFQALLSGEVSAPKLILRP